jgi:hypothetical protein
MSSSQKMPNISLRIKAIALAIDRGTIPVILTGVITCLWANKNLISNQQCS